MKSLSIFIIVIVLTFSFVNSANAQRPKIGLTLSGGGAKGLAHVGILQAIDSAGLKIDYITGTSMGSIIGAMYAIGYSGNQIDSISKGLNWNELLSGKPKYTDVGIDEKDEFGRYSLEIPFDGMKAKMGTGLIESEEVWLQFSDIFFHVYDQTDFLKFDIPFKCIATDLSNGDAVVLDSGQIVRALRSSMAIPSILTSVEYGNTQLVDGGIVRNFPVSDVIEMGADYTIGVNLFSGLVKADELNSAIDVMYQITNYRDADDLVKQKKLCDILIEPPVSKYSAGSFSESSDILDIGYDMREKYYPIFKRIADSLNSLQNIEFNPNSRLNLTKKVIIDSHEFVGLKTISEDMIKRKSGLSINKEYSSAELNEAFRYMYSTLYFQYIYYELIPTEKGHAKMVIRLKEQYSGMLKVAFNYNSFVTPAIIVNYTWRNLLFDRSRSLVKLAISQDLKGRIEHKQFFGRRLNRSFTLRVNYFQQRVPFFDGKELLYLYKTGNLSTEASFHRYYGRNTAIGLHLGYYKTSFAPDVATYFRFDGYSSSIVSKFDYEYNNLDRPILPRSGVKAKINVSLGTNRIYSGAYSGSDTTINDTVITHKPEDALLRIDFYSNFYKKASSKLTILSNLQGGILSDGFYFDNIFVGGNKQLYSRQFVFSGYKNGQINATSFVSGLIGVQYKVWGEFYLLGKFNMGVYNFISETGFVDDIKDRFISGFSGTVAYNISMLPIEFSVNYSPEIGIIFTDINIGFIF